MKQVLLRKGAIVVENVPAPAQHAHRVIVEVTHSLISTGTEVSTIQLAQSSLIEKARKRPDAVSKVVDSIRVRGVARTWALVQSELDQSKPLGYSCAGRVIAVGSAVTQFQIGDRVACAGANLANHAEVVSVPSNLVVKIPKDLSDKSAAFVTVGAIALQGVRRADVRLGETVAVVGLGLIGQITVQLLTAAGCKVIAMDPEASRVKAAQKFGAMAGATNNSDLEKKISLHTASRGVDATLITASTESSEPTQMAFEITRKKGKVVVVGAVGLELNRSPFYEKEQDFLISCSYGPGRYDAKYEQEGEDYPYAYVRWTENRNMSAFLEMLDQRRVNVEDLIDAEFPIEQSADAFQALTKKGDAKPLAVVLSYPQPGTTKSHPAVKVSSLAPPEGKVCLGLIGVGSFTKTTHVPNLQKLTDRVHISAVCTNNGATASTLGRQLKAGTVATDFNEVLHDPKIEAVLIATRHNRHAEIAEAALKAGKHIYLEKPLALFDGELESLEKTVRSISTCPVFMVGFNRRFSPFSKRLRAVVQNRNSPLMVTYRVNAGALPIDHWVNTEEGGGRLRGEACHMIDLFQYLVGAKLVEVDAQPVHAGPGVNARPDENFVANLSYADGSLCQLTYTSLGHEGLPKERIECHWDGMSAVLEDFRQLSFYGNKENVMAGRQDKGHLAALETFLTSISNGISFPIPWEQLTETTRATFLLDQKSGTPPRLSLIIQKKIQHWCRVAPLAMPAVLFSKLLRMIWTWIERSNSFKEIPVRSNLSLSPIGLVHEDVSQSNFPEQFKTRMPAVFETIIRRAEDALSLRFDLLGSGPIQFSSIPWHSDFKSKISWDPKTFYADIRFGNVPGADIKVPWELSRCQHFVVLGQAYRLTGDEKYVQAFVSQIEDWWEKNPLYFGVNWSSPMDIALRACNWIAAYEFFQHSRLLTPTFRQKLASSLFDHGRHVRRHLEWGASASTNHYLSNLLGLIYIGRALNRGCWFKFGRSKFQKEILRQTYRDGFDYEASTAYHRLVTEMAICAQTVTNHAKKPFHQKAMDRLGLMRGVLTAISLHGRMPFFGDNDSGRVHGFDHGHDDDVSNFETVWIFGWKDSKVSATKMGESGFLVLRGENDLLVMGAQPNGTHGIGNHTHNDKLSVTLQVGRDMFLIDPGSGVYTPIPSIRNQLRSTVSHSTVRIDEQEQNRFDLSTLFILRNDAIVKVISHTESEVAARHTGYQRMGVVHTRTVKRLSSPLSWTLVDEFVGKGEHLFEWRFVIHPDVNVSVERDSAILTGREGKIRIHSDNVSFSVEPGIFSPAYGVMTPNKILVFREKQPLAYQRVFKLSWSSI